MNATIPEIITAQTNTDDLFTYATALSPLVAGMPWSPTVDGQVITEQVIPQFYSGQYNQVPMMFGTCYQEGALFAYGLVEGVITGLEYEAMVTDIFFDGAKFVEVLQLYPPIANDSRPPLSNLITDYLFKCPTRNMTNSISQQQSNNVYLYSFDHVLSFSQAWGPNYTICDTEVCHGSELPYVFTSASRGNPPYNMTAQEMSMSMMMSYFWSNFAWSGNPNEGPNSPAMRWPIYKDGSSVTNIVFETPTSNISMYPSVCNFWDTVGYTLG